MTDQQQRWAWVIAFVIVPFAVVHLFPNFYVSRLMAIIWVYSLFPLILLVLSLKTKEVIKLKNYSNPIVEKRLSIIAKGLGVLISVIILFYLTFPVLGGTYNLYVKRQPIEIVKDSVANQSIAVLAPGLYLGLTLSHDESTSYSYFFPTMYRFGDSEYSFLILPGTNIILAVE